MSQFCKPINEKLEQNPKLLKKFVLLIVLRMNVNSFKPDMSTRKIDVIEIMKIRKLFSWIILDIQIHIKIGNRRDKIVENVFSNKNHVGIIFVDISKNTTVQLTIA